MSFSPPTNRIVCFMNRMTATAHWGAAERKDFFLEILDACLKERSVSSRLAKIISLVSSAENRLDYHKRQKTGELKENPSGLS